MNLSKVIELDVSSSQPRRVWGRQECDSALQDDPPKVIKVFLWDPLRTRIHPIVFLGCWNALSPRFPEHSLPQVA